MISLIRKIFILLKIISLPIVMLIGALYLTVVLLVEIVEPETRWVDWY